MSLQVSLEDRTKRKRAEDSSSELQSDSYSEESKKKKKRRKHDKSSVKKKHKKEKKKKLSSKEIKIKKTKKLHKRHKTASDEGIVGPTMTITAPVVLEPREVQRSLGPMTKEQYDKKQSTTRRVFDEDTGRYRLIRGDGEIVEEIVSKERQQQINKLATAGDGTSFQSGLTQFHK